MALFDSNTSSTASPFGNSSPFLDPFQKLPTTAETNLVVDSNGSNLSRSTQVDGRIADNSLFNAIEAGVFSATQASPLVSTSPLFAPLSKPMFERTAQPFRYSASTANPFRKSSPFLNPFNKLPTPTETSLVVDNNGSNHLGSTPFDGKIAGSSLFNGPVTGIFGATHAPPLVSTSPVFSPLSKPMFERTTPFGRSASIASPFGKSSPFLKPRDKLTTTNLVVDGKTVASPVLNERASSVLSATQASPFIFSSSAFVPLSNPLFERNTKPFGCSGAMAVGTSGSTALVQKQKHFGSRTVSYAMTNHTENCVEKGMQMFNLKSINAMPVYKTKSAEELRWEDYKSGDKGGLFRYSEVWTNIVPPFEIGSRISAGLSSTNIPHFNTSSGCFSSPTLSSPIFTSLTSGSFATSSQLKDTPSWALENGRTFPSSTHGPSNNSLLSVHNSHVFSGSSWVSTSTPCLGLTSCKTNLALNVSPAITSFAPSTPLEFTQFRSGTFISSPFVSSSQSGSNTSVFSTSLPFQPVASPETKPSALSSFKLSVSEHSTEAACCFQGLGPSTAAVSRKNTSGLSPIPDISTQKNATTNPFGILPPLPQVPLLSNAKANLSVQYGISNLHVAHKPSPSWRKTSLIPRGARQTSKIHVKVRRYLSKTDTPKVSFFSDEDDALRPNHSFVLRENPRSLFIQQTEKASTTHPINSDDLTLSVEMNDKGRIQTSLSPEKEHMSPSVALVKGHEKSLAFINDINPITEDKTREEDDIAAYNDHYTDIKASILPMLRHQDYYIEPTLSELVAKEREESGYCSRVKDFVVGREGYGYVKFLDETDVRGLDLETIIQFKNCEVAVYLDETKKPPIGMGLNKAAEITLLNVICADKKTAEPITYGVELEIFEKKLRRKSEEQGAEFISYNARKGEWKFSVMHFSSYSFYEPQIKASNLCP